METDTEHFALDGEYIDEDQADPGEVDDSGVGAAIALLVALLSFLLAVVVVLLRHLLFQA